jgi:alpha-galactosidase/6-phospho-beta-glucosidase family protein
MIIANPIYDTVFKYMMSDSKVAKALLSAIIGEKIVELDFTSTEYTLKTGVEKSQIDRTLEQITVCRFDFAAKIETEEGEYKTVIIELQKAKFATDIMRFRRYLGTMYQSVENTYDKHRVKARQIYCIYLLNYEIGLSDSPIIKVDYIVSDLTTGEELDRKNEFIESLHHKSWIVQVRLLKERRRNELENLLSIFDQDNITNDKHILNIDENQFPEEYQLIIRKLREACESKQVREEMQMEDDYINELRINAEIIAEKDKTIEESKKTIEEKDKSLAEKDKYLAEKDKEIEELRRQLGK